MSKRSGIAYEITVKWPNGDEFTVDGFNAEQVDPMMDFLWASGADDVYWRCGCSECETCYDRAMEY
jgi:hypothetical protein